MKTVTIQKNEFKKMLDGPKHCVATDDFRPMLKYIRIEVKTNSITACALDGYRASRYVLSCKEPNTDEFVCYVKPVPIKESKRLFDYVTLSLDDTSAYVDIDTEYGKMQYCFAQKGGWNIDIEKIFTDARKHDREVAVNAAGMARMLNALATVTDDGSHVCVISSKENTTEGFYITAEDGNVFCEQLILPIKRVG